MQFLYGFAQDCVKDNICIMKAPKNRKVFVVGYGAATPLGATFEKT
jgi:hypothetical protein